MEPSLNSPGLPNWIIGLIIGVVCIVVMGLLVFSLKKLVQNQIMVVLGFVLAASSRPVVPNLDAESGSNQIVIGGVYHSGLVPSAPAPPTYEEVVV